MKSCFFAGMGDYSAHPLFTDDVEQRFTAIAAAVVDSERQLDLVSDFEKLVQHRSTYVKNNRTADNPRARPKPGRAKGGAAGSYPGGPTEDATGLPTDGQTLMGDYAHACFSSILNPNEKQREHNPQSCNPFDALLGGAFAARLVTRNEFLSVPKAMDAYWKECKNLESQEVWKWEECVGWGEVSTAAIIDGQTAHLGFMFGIMVEKGSDTMKTTHGGTGHTG